MSDWPSETAGEIVEPVAAGHRAHVFGIDSPNEKLPPLITSMTHTYAGQGAQLVRPCTLIHRFYSLHARCIGLDLRGS